MGVAKPEASEHLEEPWNGKVLASGKGLHTQNSPGSVQRMLKPSTLKPMFTGTKPTPEGCIHVPAMSWLLEGPGLLLHWLVMSRGKRGGAQGTACRNDVMY